MKCPNCHSEQDKIVENNAPEELKTGAYKHAWGDVTMSVTIAGEVYTNTFRSHSSGLLFRFRWYKLCGDCLFQWDEYDEYHEMS